MTWPNVTVNQVNQLLGETNEVERAVLFIGTGTKNTGKTLAVNTQRILMRCWVRMTAS
jgi:hypothetical protein